MNIEKKLLKTLESQIHKKRSGTQRVLSHLQSGKGITPLDSWRLYGVYRLGAVIFNLRRRGYNIETIKTLENGKEFATYYLRDGKNTRND